MRLRVGEEDVESVDCCRWFNGMGYIYSNGLESQPIVGTEPASKQLTFSRLAKSRRVISSLHSRCSKRIVTRACCYGHRFGVHPVWCLARRVAPVLISWTLAPRNDSRLELKMATGDGGAYSYSLTVFSPSGKLVQIEHALARVSQGTTSLGIKGYIPILSSLTRN